MQDSFDLHFMYKGNPVAVPARLHVLGYIYKIETLVDGQSVFFEKDEERQWRALIDPETQERTPDVGLLQAIINELEKQMSE